VAVVTRPNVAVVAKPNDRAVAAVTSVVTATSFSTASQVAVRRPWAVDAKAATADITTDTTANTTKAR